MLRVIQFDFDPGHELGKRAGSLLAGAHDAGEIGDAVRPLEPVDLGVDSFTDDV